MKKVLHTLIGLLLLGACGDKSGDGGAPKGSSSGSDGVGYGRLVLESSGMKTAALQLADATSDLQNCSFSMDIYRGEGSCLTPLDLTGKGNYVDLMESKTPSPDKGSARLASINETQESENGAIVGGTEYSLSASSQFVAYNEIFYNYPYKSTWDYVSISNSYEKIKFHVAGKYVTMFIATFQQPLADWDIWDSCGVAASTLEQSRFDDLTELKGMVFHRGDYLFCVKDTASETCAAEDFKWLDTSSNQLTASRPAQPRVNKWLVDDEAECEGNAERFSASFNKLSFAAKLSTTFKLYADHSHGPMSNQWKDLQQPFGEATADGSGQSPFSIYYYQANGSSSIVEGTKLEATLDFPATQSLYFDGMNATNVGSASIGDILAKVFPKTHWVLQKKAEGGVEGGSIDHYSALSVTAAIEVSGGKERQTEIEDELEAE